MRVLLIAPPWMNLLGDFRAAARLACVSPPQGLTYLAGAILEVGGACRIVDMEAEGASTDEVLRLLDAYRPDLVGLTATTPVFASAIQLARAIKAQYPRLPICLGGVHATIAGRQVLEACPAIDLLVVGEGELSLQELVTGRAPAAIRGLVHRAADGRIVENPRRPLVEDLDTLPRPARHLLRRERYGHHMPGKGFVRYASLFTSRGCPFRCVFCSQHTMYGRRMRYHSVERVVAELREIVEELDVHHVVLMDENLTLDRQRSLALCRAIREAGLELTWEGWTHAATVDEEVLRALRRAGMIRICFGIESGHPEILRRIKKGVTLEQIRRAFRLARAAGLETRGSAMLGHPHETRETALATIRFVRELEDCQQLFLNFATPYPGTELHACAEAGEGGLRLLTRDYRRYQRYGRPVIAVNDLGPGDLKRLQTLGLLAFYLTPGRLWYNLYGRAGLRSGLATGLAFLRGILRGIVGGALPDAVGILRGVAGAAPPRAGGPQAADG